MSSCVVSGCYCFARCRFKCGIVKWELPAACTAKESPVCCLEDEQKQVQANGNDEAKVSVGEFIAKVDSRMPFCLHGTYYEGTCGI